MFDIGFAELVIISIVALLVIGPERLPGAVRTASAWLRRLRRSYNEIRHEIERELHNDSIMQELRETRRDMEGSLRETREELTGDLEETRRDLETDLKETRRAIEDDTGETPERSPEEEAPPPTREDEQQPAERDSTTKRDTGAGTDT